MKEERLHPVHPGEVLLEEFLKPMHLSQNRLALDIGVHPRRINEIVLGKRSITADSTQASPVLWHLPQFWLGLQADYDLDVAMDVLGERLEREVRPVLQWAIHRVAANQALQRTLASARAAELLRSASKRE